MKMKSVGKIAKAISALKRNEDRVHLAKQIGKVLGKQWSGVIPFDQAAFATQCYAQGGVEPGSETSFARGIARVPVELKTDSPKAATIADWREAMSQFWHGRDGSIWATEADRDRHDKLTSPRSYVDNLVKLTDYTTGEAVYVEPSACTAIDKTPKVVTSNPYHLGPSTGPLESALARVLTLALSPRIEYLDRRSIRDLCKKGLAAAWGCSPSEVGTPDLSKLSP